MEKGFVSKDRLTHNFVTGGRQFDLGKLLEKFKKQFGPTAKSRGILLEIDNSKLKQRLFSGDPSRVISLMKNLFVYALNHLDDGGIFITSKTNGIGSDRYLIEITVTTSGVGIPYYALNTIFQPVGETGGHGHGSLYIAKTLALMLRGDLTVENTFGWGTKYFVQMIMEAAVPKPQPSNSIQIAGRRNYSVGQQVFFNTGGCHESC